ncbi:MULTISPECIES: B12-binding domain-containing protein [Desulfitobacterium]|uniref:Putative cobalamin binding protein n=1 Tax=Desulfitobacterium dehalogenans (strain ATCC 51507 / DSM 9161 / JW/IU-DC1) TaxID=756499 RepID=I4A4Z0_DESDJ|nr:MULTISPECIES: corrinoid protein [Desulfitobacterium]AFL99024.1 putative cobalamin binding protein [Desulfitobacterium dehalogenans ATCC 51507]
MPSFDDLSKAVLSGDDEQVKTLTKSLIDSGIDPLEIINQGLIAGMSIVGVRFKKGDMFVPEVLMAARAMSEGIYLVKPLISEGDMPSEGKVLIGTVKGDLHDIGKNLVAMMMESEGFTVINLGVDISPEQFVTAAKEHNADIIAMSALLTTTMVAMKDTIDLFVKEGLREKVRIIIGGAPISEEFANEIGADGFAPDAASACELGKKLLA